MAQQVVNRGGFQGDPGAEHIYSAFGRVNANFSELYGILPTFGLPLNKLKVQLRGIPVRNPSVMAAPPAVTTGAASGNPATATVRVVPWAGFLTLTATPGIGAISGTLTGAWAGATQNLYVRFGNNDQRTIGLTNGSTAVNWAPGLSSGGVDANMWPWNTLYNNAAIYAHNGPNIIGTRIGGALGTQSSQERFFAGTPIFPTNVGNLGIACLHFTFDGANIEFLCNNPTYLLMVIDGQTHAATYTTASANLAWTKFAFGSRVPRNITLYVNGQIASLAVEANDTITKWDRSKDLSMVFHGDSIMQQAGTLLPNGGGAAECAIQLGIPSFWGSGYGGAGYVASGPSSSGLVALADLQAVTPAPDLWLCTLGVNDAAGGALAATVLQYYQTLRAAYPNCILVATGPLVGNESAATGTYATISATIYAAMQQVVGPWIYIDNLTGNWYTSTAGATGRNAAASTSSTTTVNGGPSVNSLAQAPAQVGTWITGEGATGAVTGNGNADLYINGASRPHPTAAGSDYYARQIANAISAAVQAM